MLFGSLLALAVAVADPVCDIATLGQYVVSRMVYRLTGLQKVQGLFWGVHVVKGVFCHDDSSFSYVFFQTLLRRTKERRRQAQRPLLWPYSVMG